MCGLLGYVRSCGIDQKRARWSMQSVQLNCAALGSVVQVGRGSGGRKAKSYKAREAEKKCR